jgi:hypothetical protein
VPIDDTSALTEWAATADPPDRVYRIVAEWVFSLAKAGYRAPSEPLTLATGDPREIRAVVVPGTKVEVIWDHEHDTGMVNLLMVRTMETA